MAINALKKLQYDLENNTSQVIGTVTKTNAGTSAKATSAGYAGTSTKATSAAYAGTSRVAHWGSSGTGALAGTAVSV